jgi:ferredoxin
VVDVTGRWLRVDEGRCVGHGLCYSSFPDLFDEDAYGHSGAYPDQLTPAELADAERAAANCPEGAIRVDGGER